MTLERVTRPYSVADKRYGKLFITKTVEGTEDSGATAVLFWKASTELKTETPKPKDRSRAQAKKDKKCNNREVSRQTHIKRITNPDDEQQYIDVSVVDVITFSKKAGTEVDPAEWNAIKEAEAKEGAARAEGFSAASGSLELGDPTIVDYTPDCPEDDYKLNNPE